MIKVIAIDPGGTTGYCYAEISEGEYCHYYPFQMVDDVEDLWDRLDRFAPRFIIMEDFEYRQRARAGLDLTPVKLIGVAQLYELKAPHQCALYLQKAATGKAYYRDPTLKQHGLYKRGVPHGMDASRHLLQWLTFGAGFRFMQDKQIKDFIKILDSWNEN